MDFVSLEEARERPGLKLVTVGGIPSPWSEAAKGIIRVKAIPCVAVRFSPGDAALQSWTATTNAPVAIFDDERPRSGWAEILLLCERIAPEPALIPANPELRAEHFGLAHEICGEMGLGWCRRNVGVHESLESEGGRGFALPIARYLAGRYGYRPETAAHEKQRTLDILGMLTARLREQAERGRTYLLGEHLTALDIYAATFSVLFRPLPNELCPLPDAIRNAFEASDDETRAALDPILIEHRDRIYKEHLELPVAL